MSGKEDQTPEIVLDTTKLSEAIGHQIDLRFNELERKMTPAKTPKTLDEPTVGQGKTPFDYKPGMLKAIKDAMDDKNKIITSSFEARKELFKDVEVKTTALEDKHKIVTEYYLNENAKLKEGIGSVNPDCAVPELWADDVERTYVYPGSVFLNAWFVRWDTKLKGAPGDKLWFSTVGPASCVDLACNEPTTTAATITCPYVTLEHDACAYYLCREDIEDVVPDIIDELNAGLGDCLAKCIDNYFFNVALSCTNAGTLACTVKLSGSMIAQAMGSMRAGTYEPVVLITHPVPMSSLMQDNNFVYASRYGNRDVITGGRVVQWLGVEIHMVPKGTLAIGGGTYRSLLLAKNALGAALKHGVTIESEYSVRYQKRFVVADIRYGGVCLHPGGIFWIHSVDTGSC